jgi:hypothetical protein
MKDAGELVGQSVLTFFWRCACGSTDDQKGLLDLLESWSAHALSIQGVRPGEEGADASAVAKALAAEVARLEERLKVWGPGDFALKHKCRPVAGFGPHQNEDDGIVRKVWVGELTEPCFGWEAETHCVHPEVGRRRRVFGFNNRPGGDCLTWATISQVIYGRLVDPLEVDATERLMRRNVESWRE